MSEQSKHTPAPWAISEGSGNVFAVNCPSDGGDIVCEPPEAFPCSMSRWDANARLIAAAPDLLEALQALLAAVKTVPEMNRKCFDQVGIQVNAAIAKAKEGK